MPMTSLPVQYLRTDEPNSDDENCVIMWSKGGYKWADWTCQTTRDGHCYNGDCGNTRFRPLCQKDSLDDQLYDDYGDESTGFSIFY